MVKYGDNIYKYKTELHAHTSPASACSKISAKDLVSKYKELGYDSIVITNHFAHYYISDKAEKQTYIEKYLKDYYDAKIVGDKIGINVILGAEFCFSECVNDYLMYGIDESIFENAFDYLWRGIKEFSIAFRKRDNVLIQAHPFRDNMTRADLKYLDGIEGFNMHPTHNSRNSLALKWARENDCIITAGSDCHDSGWEGLSSILTKQEMKSSYDIAAVLKSNDYLLEIGGCIIIPPNVNKNICQ